MASAKRPLTSDEHNLLQTDDSGGLFWKGKKVRLGGLSAAAISAILAALALLYGGILNYPTSKASVKVVWSDIKGALGIPAKH
jgi:hypothetical protein